MVRPEAKSFLGIHEGLPATVGWHIELRIMVIFTLLILKSLCGHGSLCFESRFRSVRLFPGLLINSSVWIFWTVPFPTSEYERGFLILSPAYCDRGTAIRRSPVRYGHCYIRIILQWSLYNFPSWPFYFFYQCLFTNKLNKIENCLAYLW